MTFQITHKLLLQQLTGPRSHNFKSSSGTTWRNFVKSRSLPDWCNCCCYYKKKDIQRTTYMFGMYSQQDVRCCIRTNHLASCQVIPLLLLIFWLIWPRIKNWCFLIAPLEFSCRPIKKKDKGMSSLSLLHLSSFLWEDGIYRCVQFLHYNKQEWPGGFERQGYCLSV